MLEGNQIEQKNLSVYLKTVVKPNLNQSGMHQFVSSSNGQVFFLGGKARNDCMILTVATFLPFVTRYHLSSLLFFYSPQLLSTLLLVQDGASTNARNIQRLVLQNKPLLQINSLFVYFYNYFYY